jgi:cyclophilin family peptidyl-prolyl cis-trans isomerase
MKRFTILLTALITLGMINETQAQSTKVLIKTSMGNITVMLYDDTPIHKDNMLELIKKDVYSGTLFHRVIPAFMIQGGDPTSKDAKPGQQLGAGGPGYTIPAEIKPNHFHKKGALAAARQGDQVNPAKASSGSQFYIVQGNVYSVAQLTQMETTGQHPKFTEEQKKAYTTLGGTPHLDYNYTVYGEVTEGLDVLDKIAAVPCTATRPITDVKIISVSVVK